eukprot:6594061-Lingulodinium_polyedra.AAC.1
MHIVGLLRGVFSSTVGRRPGIARARTSPNVRSPFASAGLVSSARAWSPGPRRRPSNCALATRAA